MVCDILRFQARHIICIHILGGDIRGRNGAVLGWIEQGLPGNEVCVEVDLRSSKKEERTIRFIMNGKIQKYVVIGVGNEIRFGVWNNPIVLLTFLLFIITLLRYTILLINLLIRFQFLEKVELDLSNI